MQKKNTGGINIGTSSILVIFVLLALVTFAALSYLSAKSDYTLSKEAADRTASYYDANRMAEIYMANIEGLLAKNLEVNADEEAYYESIPKVFADNDRIEVVKEDGNVLMNYTVSVTEGQNLCVSLKAHYPTAEDSHLLYIEKWSTSVNQEWLTEVKNGGSEKSGVKLLF